jgi:ABC-type multidrug transport system fused ATPase/permease subunit
MNIPLRKLMFLVSLMQQNVEGIKHIDDILYAEEIPDAAEPKIPAGSSLEFEGVSFSYGDREVLHNVLFRVEPGQLTGIVGPSGGGKTTIAQLAARFWDIGRGHIRIGGADIIILDEATAYADAENKAKIQTASMPASLALRSFASQNSGKLFVGLYLYKCGSA